MKDSHLPTRWKVNPRSFLGLGKKRKLHREGKASHRGLGIRPKKQNAGSFSAFVGTRGGINRKKRKGI